MNKLLHAIILSVLFLAIYSDEVPPQLLDEITDPNQIIHSLNETSIDTSLLDQVKNLNVAKEDPADVVTDHPATDGTLIDNTDDFKTTDYLDPSEDAEAYEPLLHSTGEDDDIQQYRSHIATDSGNGEDDIQIFRSHIATDSGNGEDDIQIFRSSVKHAPEEGEDGEIQQYRSHIATVPGTGSEDIQIFSSSIKHAPENGEDEIQQYRSHIATDSGNGEDDIQIFRSHIATDSGTSGDDTQIFSSSIKHAPEQGQEDQPNQTYQSPIAKPKEDEAIGTSIDNLDDFRTIDTIDNKQDKQADQSTADITVSTEDGEYTQGQLIDNLDDFRTIDSLDANDPDIINNAEEKLNGEPEGTPGFEVPPTVHDRSDAVKEASTGEADDKKIETIDVQEKGFLPKN